MGWTYPHGLNRKQLIAQRVEGREPEINQTSLPLSKTSTLCHVGTRSTVTEFRPS